MVNHIGGVERLVATCRKSGIAADIDACDFQNNIESYGVTFHIENGNITLAEEYLSFLAKKLEGWRFGEG